jgi:sulfatase maturation enzyme AslB (radical SAM superfamily)
MQIECDGELKPCCLYKPHLDKSIKQYHISEYQDWWTSHLAPMRQTVLDNQIDPGCAYCFEPGTGNHPMKLASDRMFKNTTTVSDTPEWLDIRFGNYCNLKCIMCSPLNSSQIEQEYLNNTSAYNEQNIIYYQNWKNFPIKTVPDNWWDHEETFQQVVKIVNNAKYVNFSGGEPLMMPAFYRLLDEMDPGCTISINTNLTRVTDRTIESFKKFKHVLVSVSLDGVGVHQEYIRWGSSWPELDANIQQVFKLKNVSLVFSYLLQHTSVYTWANMWNYLKHFDRDVMVHPVYGGTIGDGILTQDSIVPADMQKFAEWHQHNSTPYDSAITQWIDSYNFDPVKHQQYRDYVGMLDRIRGCDFVKTFAPSW